MLDQSMIAAVLIVLGSGVIGGFAGFGFSLVSVPLLLLFFNPATVVLLNLTLPLVSTTVNVVDARTDVRLRLVLALLPWATIGLFVGSVVLHLLDPLYLKVGVSIVVVGFSLMLLYGVTPHGIHSRWAVVVAGGISGILSTATGIGGPPVIMFLTARQLPKNPFRASASAYFLIIDIIGIVSLQSQGLLHNDQVPLVAFLLPITFVGTLIGRNLLSFVSNELFRTLTLLLILLTGLEGIGTAALSFLTQRG